MKHEITAPDVRRYLRRAVLQGDEELDAALALLTGLDTETIAASTNEALARLTDDEVDEIVKGWIVPLDEGDEAPGIEVRFGPFRFRTSAALAAGLYRPEDEPTDEDLVDLGADDLAPVEDRPVWCDDCPRAPEVNDGVTEWCAACVDGSENPNA